MNISMNFIRPASIVAAAMLLFACTESEPPKPQPEPPKPEPVSISPEQSAAMRQALVEWLECEECEEGQLEAVVKYGEPLKPLLISALDQGASPASIELYRRALAQRHDELVAYSQDNPEAAPTLPKDEFVALYLGNYNALYRTRAAEALAEIGGQDAIDALNRAAASAQREDVAAHIRALLEEAK